MATVSRAFTRSKSHALLCRKARVALDRSSTVVLYKLLVDGDDINLSCLAARVGMDCPGTTRKVQQLERQGLLKRVRDEDDARAFRIHLTGDGRRTAQKLMSARAEWMEELLASWTDRELGDFSRLLEKFAVSIGEWEDANDD